MKMLTQQPSIICPWQRLYTWEDEAYTKHAFVAITDDFGVEVRAGGFIPYGYSIRVGEFNESH